MAPTSKRTFGTQSLKHIDEALERNVTGPTITREGPTHLGSSFDLVCFSLWASFSSIALLLPPSHPLVSLPFPFISLSLSLVTDDDMQSHIENSGKNYCSFLHFWHSKLHKEITSLFQVKLTFHNSQNYLDCEYSSDFILSQSENLSGFFFLLSFHSSFLGSITKIIVISKRLKIEQSDFIRKFDLVFKTFLFLKSVCKHLRYCYSKYGRWFFPK